MVSALRDAAFTNGMVQRKLLIELSYDRLSLNHINCAAERSHTSSHSSQGMLRMPIVTLHPRGQPPGTRRWKPTGRTGTRPI